MATRCWVRWLPGRTGRWSYTPDTLDEGDHSLSTTVTDKAGTSASAFSGRLS
ncbi:Ig-like domain-containing protein [Klebsiella oxytoca]|uniref:Ig-like domain-containing protein n=1 Tax=Klebsiella oxytoca TaxID=571 RepID=UPI00227B8727|nr:Ig-like domain-containing protein [Klebsiella oxytoca]